MNRQTITDEANNTGSSKTEDDVVQLFASSQQHINSNYSVDSLIASQPATQMKQMQDNTAKMGATSTRQTSAVAMTSGPQSLIEIQALGHQKQGLQLQQMHQQTTRKSPSNSPMKATRQASQQNQVRATTGLKNILNYQSQPNTFESSKQQHQQSGIHPVHQKQRKNSPPLSSRQIQAKSRSQKKKVGHEPNFGVKDRVRSLQQLAPKALKPGASTNLSARKHKKSGSLLREQSSPEKTTNQLLVAEEDSASKMVENLRSEEESQDEEQPAAEERSNDEEINYFTNKAEDSLNKRPIGGTNTAQIRASERNRQQQFDIEEEKEVPSEHPNNRQITPTRNGCNVTARKGFSFENMNIVNQKNIDSVSFQQEVHITETDQDLVQSSEAAQDMTEAGFVLIEQESDTEEAQNREQQLVGIKSSMIKMRRNFVEQKSNNFNRAYFPQQNVSQMNINDDLPSNESASIEENKATMQLLQLQNTQKMARVHQVTNNYAAPPRTSHHYNNHGPLNNNFLHQSMASCDLQASFQRNDTRNPQETTSRTKTMMHDTNSVSMPLQNQQLIDSQEYQAISKTRLWREIFYLRELLGGKNQQVQQMEQSMNSLKEQLEAQKRRNDTIETQLEILQRREAQPLNQNQLPILQNELVVTDEQDVGAKQEPHHGIQKATQDIFQRQSIPASHNLQSATLLQVEQEQSASLMSNVPASTTNAGFEIIDQRSATTSPQPVNCFNPPTKASQLRIQQPAHQTQLAHLLPATQNRPLSPDEDSMIIRETGHAMPLQGLNMIQATRSAQQSQQQRRQNDIALNSSSASIFNRVDEENNPFNSTQNESAALINKVNEMQTKTASFGYQPTTQQQDRRFYMLRQQQNPRQQFDRAQVMMQDPPVESQEIQQQQQINATRGLTFVEQEQFMEYEIDEQVASGVRLMMGPRSGPPRSQIVQNNQTQMSRQTPIISTAPAQIQLTTLSQHNQIEVPPTMQTQALQQALEYSVPSVYQNTQLQQQRPCDQPPPRNIQGDIQSHVDAEEASALEGVGSGLVPQQRIPLPNQQQQPMPRQPSHDSLLDPDFPHGGQVSASFSFQPPHQMGGRPLLRSNPSLRHHQQHFFYQPSVADDAGMDEFDVADERLHLFGEQVNPDIMTYEQLLALQERIGFVPKGMTVQDMDKYPTMKRSEVRQYLRVGQKGSKPKTKVKVHQTQSAANRGKSGSVTAVQDLRPDGENASDFQLIDYYSQQQQPLNYSSEVHLVDGSFAQAVPYIEDEEEKKSYQESLGEKSLNLQESSQESSDPIQGGSRGKSGSSSQQLQLEENYQSMQNSRTSAAIISETHLSQQMNSVRQRNFKVPMIEPRDGEESGQQPAIEPHRSRLNAQQSAASLTSPYEEGKEDLEEAAPEEHHPKEEHLQQIGVSVPMPGHHIAIHASSNHSSNPSMMRQVRRQPTRPPQQQRNAHPATSIVSEEEENNGSQDVSQEDVFDEGEDVLNRRLPIVVNINGSIPNQRPSRISEHQNIVENNIQDFERQHPLYAGALAIQSNLARHSRAPTKEYLQQPAQFIDDELANTSNIYEEHKENEFGVQTPKYAQTKTSHKQNESGSVRTQGENHLDDEISTYRQIDQPTIVKHRGHQLQQQQRPFNNPNSALISMNKQRAEAQQQQSTPSLAAQSSSCSRQSSRSGGVSTTLGQEVCIICQEIFVADDPVKVLPPCQHYFHVDCVNQWLLVEKKCPMCMHVLD